MGITTTPTAPLPDPPSGEAALSLYLVSGEISGDTHGAALMEALKRCRPVTFSGLGGPLMHQVDPHIEDWIEQAAVLGLWEVLKKYSYFRDKMASTAGQILREQPDGIVFIDYPGFNLRLAERLRKSGYSGQLIYYISPQVWAWKKGRIKTMARLLDLMVCIFPFEEPLYETSGLRTIFAGHPLVDTMAEKRSQGIVRQENLVALLPGSREREIAKLYPIMLEAARELRLTHPELRFATSGATPALTQRLLELTANAGLSDLVTVNDGGSHRLMQEATVGVLASGTATLEAACLGLPYCLTYQVAPLTAWVARRVMSVNHLGMVNVLAGQEIVRELLQGEANGPNIAAVLRPLIDHPENRTQLQNILAEIVAKLGDGGAHQRAAEAVLSAWD